MRRLLPPLKRRGGRKHRGGTRLHRAADGIIRTNGIALNRPTELALVVFVAGVGVHFRPVEAGYMWMAETL